MRYAILLNLIFAITACGGSGSSSGQTPNTNSPSEDAFEAINLNATNTKVQPMTGIVFWAENSAALNTLGDSVQLEFSYMIYSDIVAEAGIYDWSAIDNLLDAVSGRRHQAILRFRYTYPGYTEVTVPAYIANSAGYNSTTAQVEGQTTFLPDWSFAELETFTRQFFVDFAARYDGDPRLAMLQVGFGSYSEYHLYDGPVSVGNNFPSKAFQESFLNTMDSSFTTTQWSVSIDASNDAYSPFVDSPSLQNLSFGLFDDSFMHETHSENDSEYNRAAWLFFGEDRYQTSMVGGEFSYYSNYDQQNVLALPNGPWGRSFESFAAQYNMSYILGNDQLGYQSATRISDASVAMGYKFNVDSFEASDTQSRGTISNTGIAPIYYDAYPTVNGVRSETSLKGLLPGNSVDFSVNAGGDSPLFSIESDYLVSGQVIGFSTN